MKQIALYIILFSYGMVILKPASPYIYDAVEHIFNYTQHMATVHYENGKYHVHKELVDNSKKTESSKEIPSAKKDNSSNDHISIKQKESITVSILNRIFQIPVSSSLQHNYLPGDYPPPRA